MGAFHGVDFVSSPIQLHGIASWDAYRPRTPAQDDPLVTRESHFLGDVSLRLAASAPASEVLDKKYKEPDI